MIAAAVRPQRNAVDMTGQMFHAWEFDYHSATFYIQETADGYVVIEETHPRGAWMPVQPERSRMILAEFERVRRRRRM
jgi:hypothetical protein